MHWRVQGIQTCSVMFILTCRNYLATVTYALQIKYCQIWVVTRRKGKEKIIQNRYNIKMCDYRRVLN
jgi:hypothetical protein